MCQMLCRVVMCLGKPSPMGDKAQRDLDTAGVITHMPHTPSIPTSEGGVPRLLSVML